MEFQNKDISNPNILIVITCLIGNNETHNHFQGHLLWGWIFRIKSFEKMLDLKIKVV